MKIIHFSDPHVGLWPSSGTALYDKRIIGSLNYVLFRKSHFNLEVLQAAIDKTIQLEPQVVVISGDITSVGSPEEFALARKLLRPLVQANLKLIYIPGNHDAYVKNRACVAALAETFSYLNQGRYELSDLPLKYSIGEVSFLLLNQAIPTVPYLSCGLLNKASVKLLQEPRTTAHEVKVAIGHFPVKTAQREPLAFRRQLKNGRALVDTLEQANVDAYLCGHIHKPFINLYGSVLEVCAGSISANGHLNVLEINQVKGTLEQRWEVISSKPDHNEKINSLCLPDLQYSGNSMFLARVPSKINEMQAAKSTPHSSNGDSNE